LIKEDKYEKLIKFLAYTFPGIYKIWEDKQKQESMMNVLTRRK